MRHFGLLVFALAVALFLPSSEFGAEKAVKSTSPLSADEIAIYQEVLRSYAGKDSESLNVSLRTVPLDITSDTGAECLKDQQLTGLDSASRTFHEFTPDMLPGKNFKLVDPKKQARTIHNNDPSKTIRDGSSVDSAVRTAFSTGLFSMSEIAFDKDHRHAVVHFSFWCGSLCGHGSTKVFEKVGTEWKDTGRNCGGWIS